MMAAGVIVAGLLVLAASVLFAAWLDHETTAKGRHRR